MGADSLDAQMEPFNGASYLLGCNWLRYWNVLCQRRMGRMAHLDQQSTTSAACVENIGLGRKSANTADGKVYWSTTDERALPAREWIEALWTQ